MPCRHCCAETRWLKYAGKRGMTNVEFDVEPYPACEPFARYKYDEAEYGLMVYVPDEERSGSLYAMHFDTCSSPELTAKRNKRDQDWKEKHPFSSPMSHGTSDDDIDMPTIQTLRRQGATKFSEGLDQRIDQAIDYYLGRHGPAWRRWRSGEQIVAAVEASLGDYVIDYDVYRWLVMKEHEGDVKHRVVKIANGRRHEWSVG